MSDLFHTRASGMGELFDCPARFEAKHIHGLRTPYSGAMWLGTSIHRSTAVYDQATLDQSPITLADAADVVVETLREPDNEIQWDDVTQNNAEKIGVKLTNKYCTEVAPDQRYDQVETTCRPLLLDFPDKQLQLKITGTPDRVHRTPAGEFGITDLKTGKRAASSAGRGHAVQVGIYNLLIEQTTQQRLDAPASIIGLQTTKTPKVSINEMPNSKGILVGERDRPGLLEYAAILLKQGLFYGNPRSMLCHERYCPIYANCRWRK